MKTTYDYHPGEDIEIIVGDEKQQDFKPRMKIKRWDNEVNFSVGIITKHQGTNASISDKVVWDDGHGMKARFYHLPPDEQDEYGKFEFEIILDKKPASNVVEMSIETKGLRFNYQPPLTPEEMDGGHGRPDNVIGSYAVYHATKKNDTSALGGKNYRCGKAFHIYRPKIIDANGEWTWAELNVNLKDKKLSITIDQKWLDEAAYPIIVDPTFGQTDTAGSYRGFGTYADDIYGLVNIFPCDVTTILSMHIYCRCAFVYPDNDTFNMKGIIVLNDLTIITNGITDVVNVTSSSNHWETLTFGTDPDATGKEGEQCVLCFIMDEAGGSSKGVAYDSTSAMWSCSVADASNSYASPTNPTDMSTDITAAIYEYSIYATYTAASPPAGGGATQLVNGGLVS